MRNEGTHAASPANRAKPTIEDPASSIHEETQGPQSTGPFAVAEQMFAEIRDELDNLNARVVELQRQVVA